MYLIFIFCILFNDAVLGKNILDDNVKYVNSWEIVHYQPEQVHLSFGGKKFLYICICMYICL